MRREQRDALAELARPRIVDEVLVEVRATLERLALSWLVAEVAAAFCVDVDDVLAGCRNTAVAAARHEVWRRMMALNRWSYAEVAAFFQVDHKTVFDGVRVAKERAGGRAA